jgi:cytoskeletal protein CcmA (bactofilin family)
VRRRPDRRGREKVPVAIFGKTDSASQDPPAADRAPGSGSTGGGQGPTVLGPGARFVGEISGDEDIVIQGRCEGNIRVDRKVTISATGEILGDVHARWVVVGGRVRGLIRAGEKVELLASASVQGNVHAPKVIIAEGAQLQGSVAMSADAAPAPTPARNEAEEN